MQVLSYVHLFFPSLSGEKKTIGWLHLCCVLTASTKSIMCVLCIYKLCTEHNDARSDSRL